MVQPTLQSRSNLTGRVRLRRGFLPWTVVAQVEERMAFYEAWYPIRISHVQYRWRDATADDLPKPVFTNIEETVPGDV